MQLLINDNIKVDALQKAFSKMFPFLHLVFYANTKDKKSFVYNQVFNEGDIKLATCRTLHNIGVIDITAETTVNELIGALNNQFGLSAEVMRQSGKAWLETTVTKNWTLEEQNEQGRALSQKVE